MTLNLPNSLLPNGNEFAFWQDETTYSRVYHVAQNHPEANDEKNPGTESLPYKTINRAASIVEPGEKVVVHEGIYRECVRPERGGTGLESMICYEAAEGEYVVVSGAEMWRPEVRPSTGWELNCSATTNTRSQLVRDRTPPPIWQGVLPEAFFGSYNPFLLRNAYQCIDKFSQLSNEDFVRRTMMRRGMIFFNDQPLNQVYRYNDLLDANGSFWVDAEGYTIHFRLPGDLEPVNPEFEVTAREQAFAPAIHNLGYIKVCGFDFQHVADGFPIPQRAMVSTSIGHHWIIQDNSMAWANACGLDIGCQHWDRSVPMRTGDHVIRGNTIRHCGICGIAGVFGIKKVLIEDNLIEHVGFRNVERMWECAGLKFHFAEDSLIRRNVFRHHEHACGLWLDCSDVNNRISNNVFTNIKSILGGIYSEMNFETNLIDHNVIWDIRDADENGDPGQGPGVKADCNEYLMVCHNFIGACEGGIMITLNQSDRKHEGRTGVCYANQVLNNVVVRNRIRVQFGSRQQNVCNGNVYNIADTDCGFQIQFPPPESFQDLTGWQRFFGFDQEATEVQFDVGFDANTLELTLRMTGERMPQPSVITLGDQEYHAQACGPLTTAQWQRLINGETLTIRFPQSSHDG